MKFLDKVNTSRMCMRDRNRTNYIKYELDYMFAELEIFKERRNERAVER